MSNYSDDVRLCRVDFFKDSGKWYTTEAILFPDDTYKLHPVEALTIALQRQIGGRLSSMIAVCLSPYVENQFPVMLIGWKEGE